MILYVDRSDDDAFLFGRALKKVAPEIEWRHVSSIHDAKCYLKGQGIYADRTKYPFPDLLLTDFKFLNGEAPEFLRWAHAQRESAKLPFCLFTDLPPHLRGDLPAFHPPGICLLEKPPMLADWPSVLKEILECHSRVASPKRAISNQPRTS